MREAKYVAQLAPDQVPERMQRFDPAFCVKKIRDFGLNPLVLLMLLTSQGLGIPLADGWDRINSEIDL